MTFYNKYIKVFVLIETNILKNFGTFLIFSKKFNLHPFPLAVIVR